VRDHGEKRPRRSAWPAFALFPVSDGLNRHTEPCREFKLRQARTPAKVTNHWERPWWFGRGQRCYRRERKLLSVPQLDDPSVRFQPQALHVRPSFDTRSRPQNRTPLGQSRAAIVGDAR
jgi:hypothetical protein